MRTRMTRGKQQILLNYLPGSVFDFDRSSTIAQVTSIDGKENTELNVDLVVQAIKRYAAIWQEKLSGIFFRPQPDLFVLLEPKKVFSKIYPKVLWCQNPACGRVFDYSNSNEPLPSKCYECSQGQLIQLRWIKVHRCGNIEPLTPPHTCDNCKTARQFSLDTGHSERVRDFLWVCKHCQQTSKVLSFYCRECNWKALTGESNSELRRMSINLHRAGHTYYPHSVVMLNQPGSQMKAF